MTKRSGARSLSEQLNDAVEVLRAGPDARPPSVDPQLEPLLQIAADLRDLPSEDFKARLKADLERDVAARAAEPPTAKPIPKGYRTATPCLVLRDAGNAIDFYKRAFGATELMRFADPSGQIVHAEIQVGDSRIAIAPEAPDWGNLSPQALGGSPVPIQLYVEDVDAFAAQAVGAGATVLIPVADQFYGDRAGRLADPFGHIWIVATHQEDVSADEMQKRAATWMHEQVTEPTAVGSYRVEPHLPVQGASRLIDFLQQAFAAQETSRHTRPDGSIAHAEVRIGDSVIGTGDATALQPSPTAIHLYVPNADAVYERAVHAGATSTQEPTDQPYGDREAGVKDPFGNRWYIATHKGDTYIPAGLHSINSYLHPHGAPQLIDFLKRAFGAEEAFRTQAPDGTVVHAKIRIGESIVEMGEAHGPYQPMPTVYHLYVNDTDAVYRHALEAGGHSLSQPADQAWGYRNAGVQDPSGNQWWINAPIEGRSPAAHGTIETVAEQPTPEATTSSHTVTPFLLVRDVTKTADLLKQAFGAELILFERGGDPPHDHAELRIGNSMLMMGEATPGYEPTSSAFYLHAEDADAMYQRALKAGLTSTQPPQDKPWGDRMAHVKDALGNSWFIAAHKK
jgi:PhnB protein